MSDYSQSMEVESESWQNRKRRTVGTELIRKVWKMNTWPTAACMQALKQVLKSWLAFHLKKCMDFSKILIFHVPSKGSKKKLCATAAPTLRWVDKDLTDWKIQKPIWQAFHFHHCWLMVDTLPNRSAETSSNNPDGKNNTYFEFKYRYLFNGVIHFSTQIFLQSLQPNTLLTCPGFSKNQSSLWGNQQGTSCHNQGLVWVADLRPPGARHLSETFVLKTKQLKS